MSAEAHAFSASTTEKHQSLWEQYHPIFSALFANRLAMAALVITAILGYGFKITNVVIGVDDPLFRYYMDRPSFEIVAQDRGIFLLYDKIIGMGYLPFWMDFLCVLLFMAAAICWAALFQRMANNKLGIFPLTIFMTALLSYPLISTIFIFTGANFAVCLGYLLTPLALMFASERIFFQASKMFHVYAIIILAIAISPYESFAPLFLCGISSVLFLRYWFANAGDNLKLYLKNMFKYLLILLLAIAGKYIISQGFRWFFGIQNVSKHPDENITWLSQQPFLWKIHLLLHSVFHYPYDSSFSGLWTPQFWAREFTIIVAVLLLFAIVLTIVKKSWLPITMLLLLIFSAFSLTILKGYSAPERTCQSYALLIAFTFLLLLTLFKKVRPIYVALMVGSVFLVLAQTRDLNFWFYNNYKRYQIDRRTFEQIAWEIQRNYDCNKPVAFVGYFTNKIYYPNVKTSETNGYSAINWSLGIINENSPALWNFFKMHGYDFIQANAAQEDWARTVAQKMPEWPKAGSIAEFPQVIVVHFTGIDWKSN